MFKKVIGILIGISLFTGTLYGLLILYGRMTGGKIGTGTVLSTSRAGKLINVSVKNGDKSYESSFDPSGFKIPIPRSFNIVANGSMKVTYERSNELIYQVTYRLNPFGMRSLEHKKDSMDPMHLILAGCSFTFGEGLPLEDTVSYLLEQSLNGYNNYNLGVMGGGINTTLHFFDLVDMNSYIKESRGFFIYVFMQNHLNRFFARSDYLAWASAYYPHFAFEEGKVAYKGLLGTQDFFKKFKELQRSGLLDSYLRAQGMIQKRDSFSIQEYASFSEVVSLIRKRYLEKFPQGKFIILRHPSHGMPQGEWRLFQGELRKRGLEVWDGVGPFQEFVKRSGAHPDSFSIKHDGHPSAAMNQFIANMLREKISAFK